MVGLYPKSFREFGINRKINHRSNPNRKDRIIKLLYKFNKSLSFSVKNNKAKHTQIQNMKNQNKSYFALKRKALIHTCCNHMDKSRKIIVVITNININ